MGESVATASWEVPGREALSTHDPLLKCLVLLTRHFNRPFAEETLSAGLPLVDNWLTPDLFERAAEMSDYFLDRMFDLKSIKAVTDIRGYGMLAGIDLAPAERPGLRGYDATKRLFKRGLHIKFTGDSGICAPALVAEKRDIDEIYAIFREVFSEY